MAQPKFKPKPGQVDFTNARWAPVMNCVLKYKNKILIVQRSKDVGFYPGYWNGVSAFLDDEKSLKQKIQEELKEELGMARGNILNFHLGEIYHEEAIKYKKTWIVHPVLVEVTTDKIRLDWEAKSHKWVKLREIKGLKLLPGFLEVLKKLEKWIAR
jgi:isopentenyldiphosphate isomerase